MTIRSLIATSALTGMLTVTPALAETLRVSTYLPPNHTFVRAVQSWGDEVTQASNGDLQFEYFPAAQLGPPQRQFDLVRAGNADIAIFLHGSTPGRFPMSELAGLPLTAPEAGNDSAITSRRLTELAPDYLAAEHPGTRILWMAVTPPLKLHFSRVDPGNLDNIRGTRIRYAGVIWQQIVEAMGASPAPVPPAEAADAMSRGVVDGAAFPFEATQSFDLGPVTRFSAEPGIASATFAVVIGDRAWDRLSPEQQQILTDTTGPDRAQWFGALWDAGEAEGRRYMEEAGVTIVQWDEAQLDQLSEAFSGIVGGAVSAVGGNAPEFVAAYTE